MRTLTPYRGHVTLFVAALFALALASCEAGPDSLSPAQPTEAVAEADLPTIMMFMQRYAEKLHMAGEGGSWELAAFYAHELEEVGEELRDGGFEKQGVDIGSMTDSMFLPALHRLDEAIDVGPEAFRENFLEMVATCNTCHVATGYGFIEIIVPGEERPYPSQRFVR